MNIDISDLSECQAPPSFSPENAPSYWAKLTTFKNGSFELAVTLPSPLDHHKVEEPYRGALGDSVQPMQLRKEVMTPEEKEAANKARSVRRSRQTVRHTIKALEADHMLTLTYRENMQDVDRLKADFKRFVRLVTAKHPDWRYVAVKETQERGALHLHLAVKGRQDIRYLLRCWYIAIGGSIHDTGADTKGAVNVRAPHKRWRSGGKAWKCDKLAGYLTKYLGKEIEAMSLHHAKRYWSSRTIEKPTVVKFWLGATNFKDAIVESHNFVYHRGANDLSLWAADDWQNIWISGGGLCPF
ncbi:MAG: hypothetical protein ABL856_01630 [Gallionella sp.]